MSPLVHLLNSCILEPLCSSRLPKIRSFIFRLETESEHVPRVEVQFHNYRLCCYRLSEKQLPLGSTDACDGNWNWMAFMSHQVLDPRLPWELICFFLHLPLSDAERRVNAAWCYVPSVHLSLQYALELRAIWGLMAVLVTCPGRESLNYSPGRKCRDSR